MKHITILIPDFPESSDTAKRKLMQKHAFRSLEFLTSKGTQKKSQLNYLAVLADYFKLPHIKDASLAELTAHYDGLDVQQRFWLRADPVELKADLAAVFMYGTQHLQLSAEQINLLKDLIQPLLNDFQIRLHTPTAHRWYFELLEAPEIISSNPHALIGKDVLAFLPKNTGKIHWQKLQTEIQMALFQLPDNFGVNSLWFWGAGEKLQHKTCPQNIKLFSDEPISLGLAKQYHIAAMELPKSLSNLDEWIDGENLIIYDKFSFAKNQEEFVSELENLDKKFIQCLLIALKKNKIDKISLNFLNGYEWQFKKTNFYHFWKLLKSLKL